MQVNRTAIKMKPQIFDRGKCGVYGFGVSQNLRVPTLRLPKVAKYNENERKTETETHHIVSVGVFTVCFQFDLPNQTVQLVQIYGPIFQ